MSRRRIVFSSLVCFGLIACLAVPSSWALTPEEENFGEAPEPITVWPLPAAELAYMAANYLEFDSTFTISVYWNPADTSYSSPADWPWPFYDPDPQAANGTMEEFIQAVMPPALPQDDMYDESAMRRTFYYFGHDRDFDNDQEPWAPYYPTHVKWIVNGQWGYITHFNIEIRPPGGGSWQANETIHLSLPNGPISLERMAFDGFAHEWKHLIQGTIGWAAGRNLGADYTPSEFFAQCAEYLSGWFWLNPTDASTRVELPYTRGLFSGDYYQACEENPADTTQAGHPQVLKHMTYSMFAPYLMDRYSLGTGYSNEAMFRWIHSKEDPLQAEELPARGDLKGLSLLLATDPYVGMFSATTGDGRVREMLQEFALSLWVNDPNLMGEASVWANGASPSGTHGYMVDFDNNCTNDVHTLPLYNVVTGTHKSQTDWVTLADLYPDSPSCAGSPPYPRRALQVSTYGYNVLPFVAAPAIQNEALAYDLRVDVSVDDSYWCDLSDEDVDAELTNNEVLHFYVLGYPEATSALHEAGSEAELINTYEFSDFDINATPTFSFSVGRFGVRYKSVVLIMTLTEKELEDGPRTAKVLPFDYSYWAEGHTAPITADTYWPSASLIHDSVVSLNGEVTVESGAKLTIMPGTQIFCADQAAVVGGVVGFDVEGVLQIGVPEGETVHMDPAQGTWTGISVANSAALSIFSSDIAGFSEISAGANSTVDFAESNFELADEGAGYALSAAGSAEVTSCQFVGSGVFSIGGSAQVGPHALTSSQFTPPPSQAEGPALFFAGDATVEDVTMLGAGPIIFGSGDISVTGLNATAAGIEGLELGLLVGVGVRLALHDSEFIGLTELSAGTGAAVAISGTSFELDPDGAGYALAAADTLDIQDCQFTGTGILSIGNATTAHSLGTSTFSPLPGDVNCTELVVENSASIASVLLNGGGIRCMGGASELNSVELNAPDLAIQPVLTGIAVSGDAVAQAEECTVVGFDYAIRIDDTAMLTLRSSYLDGMQVGVMLNSTQVVDLGRDGSVPDSPNWGNNCFEMASGAVCRISRLRKNASCLAEMNYWGAETPLEGFFCGVGVDYEPFLSECPLEPPGGGQFSFGVVLPGETSSTALKLTVYPNPGNPSFVITTVLPVSGEAYSLAIYDVAGRLVRALAAGTADGHEHQATWDGNDKFGNPSGSGVYFVQIRVGASTAATQKLVLIR